MKRIQVNAFNRDKLSVMASFTSGSTTVGVPDGTKFAVGMPVNFTTAGAGYAAKQGYIVKSVSGNTITPANDTEAAAISASATTTLPLESYGFANVV